MQPIETGPAEAEQSELLLTLPSPNPKQLRFLTDEHRYVGYGGARGGGKPAMVQGSVQAAEAEIRAALEDALTGIADQE